MTTITTITAVLSLFNGVKMKYHVFLNFFKIG